MVCCTLHPCITHKSNVLLHATQARISVFLCWVYMIASASLLCISQTHTHTNHTPRAYAQQRAHTRTHMLTYVQIIISDCMIGRFTLHLCSNALHSFSNVCIIFMCMQKIFIICRTVTEDLSSFLHTQIICCIVTENKLRKI